MRVAGVVVNDFKEMDGFRPMVPEPFQGLVHQICSPLDFRVVKNLG